MVTRIGDLENDFAKWAFAREGGVPVFREEDREAADRNGYPQFGSIFDETDVIAWIELTCQVLCTGREAANQ